MRKLRFLPLFLLCLSALWTAVLTGQTSEGRVRPDYAQTLQSLLPLVESGRQNADLYYNLGVCYYHLGQTGKAALYFLRAQNLNSAHRQARDNLAFIQSQDTSGIKAPPRPFLVQILFNIYDFFSLNRLAVLFLILSVLSTLSVIWLLNYPLEKEHGLPVLVLGILLLFWVVVGGTLLQKNHRFRHNDKAVVMQEGSALFATANETRAAQYLAEGSAVEIKQAGKRRSQVILADGSGGWIANVQLERVVPLKPTGGRS